MSTATETMATSKMDKAAYEKLAKEWAALKAWCETAGTPQHMKLAAACKAAGVDGARCIRYNAKLRDQPENMRVEYCAKKVAEYTEKQTTVGTKRKDDHSEELASLRGEVAARDRRIEALTKDVDARVAEVVKDGYVSKEAHDSQVSMLKVRLANTSMALDKLRASAPAPTSAQDDSDSE